MEPTAPTEANPSADRLDGPSTTTTSAASPAPTPAPEAPGSATPHPAAPPRRNLLDRVPVYVVPLLLLGIPLGFVVAASVAPGPVYHGVVWPYYWGPIKADADGFERECLLPDGNITQFGCAPGVGVEAHSGYNLVNTASWAILLGLCLFGTAQLLHRRKAVMDRKLIVGALGWVVAGSIFHVLEDVQLFRQPTQYIFITPPIYLLFAAFGVLSFVLGHHLKRIADRGHLEAALQKLWFWLMVPILAYLMLWANVTPRLSGQVVSYLNPILVTVFTLLAYLLAAARFRRIGRIEPNELVGFLSLAWILMAVAYVVQYVQAPWPGVVPNHPLHEALLAPILAMVVVVAVRAIARSSRNPKFAAYLDPVNGLLIFGQMLDGFATSIGIDLGGYNEKHVLSGNVIEWTRGLGNVLHAPFLQTYPTFVGFLTLKFVVSMLVVWAIDVSNPQDAERHPNVIGLVKFAIIMVGLGPGIRDFVRMALGV